MAPRGPKNQTVTSGPKNSSRGGIQKRRGPTRVDGDGDLDMGGGGANRSTQSALNTTTRLGPRSSNPRGSSRAAQTVVKHLANGDTSQFSARSSGPAHARPGKARGPTNTNIPLDFLRVHGLKNSKAASNSDGGLSDLLAFLERKATSLAAGRQKRQVTIKKSHRVGDYVFIAASKEDTEELKKVNGFTFAGSKLEVVESEDGLGHNGKATESNDTQELRSKLQMILGQRYLGSSKLLKLDSLAADAELVNLGMFANPDRALKTFKGLMAICDGLFKTAKDKQEAIESISLANNNIDDVAQVESVAVTFPHLKNLDMSGNQIRSMQSLDRWRGKFRHLETLYINQNPIEATDPNFQCALLEWFPKLQAINGTQLRTAEQIAQRAAAALPKPIPQRGPDFRDVNGIGENFLLEFFNSFDNDRQGLISRLYDEGSQFSLAVDTRSVRDPNAPTPLPWGPYIKSSRNLTRITTHNARVQRLFTGGNVIHALWKTLPLTRHPSIKDAMSKYIMDCHPLPGLVDPTGQSQTGVDGLIILVHGEFEECDQQTKATGMRSFSRAFVLGPGQPSKGGIRVLSDMLSLRAYSSLPNVFVAPPSANQPPSQPNQIPHGNMINDLVKITGMTPQFSEMCLSEARWDFNKALVIFNEKKSELPAEAFAVGLKQ